ncbi:alpha-L RNA-binding motif-containing protein [Apiospora arundinis]|uniref:Alpha-L RNA-binding motif-containing protein n=1 Tax=Apiospora arundinis TaxID=335852 RepID=A0ABR2ISF2_9PEZI
MPRAAQRRLHVLRRPKLRQSWSKYNLYNLFRQRDPKIGLADHETFFQQKWRAKGLLRAYHGEHIKERDWERMFSRRLLSVANMNPRYMAEFDGSEMAAGRGSGKDTKNTRDQGVVAPKVTTPYMNMAFAPMERRLDIAIFRALFASSARQARHFVVHGKVKVNGKVMHYPAYKLNPGDMFQVDPDSVMFATGQPKKKGGSNARQAITGSQDSNTEAEPAAEEAESAEAEAAEASAEEVPEQDPETTDKPEAPKADMKPTRQAIQKLTKQAKSILARDRDVSTSQKQNLRSFLKRAKPLLSKAGRSTATPTDILDELNSMVKELNLSDAPADAAAAAEAASSSAAAEQAVVSTRQEPPRSIEDLNADELKALQRLIKEEEENPADPAKPYHTPWKPRDYMSPFAFIPRYLEVNQNVCSAVYLRHPVARNETAEVPTPFGYQVNQLAFNWYLRRR